MQPHQYRSIPGREWRLCSTALTQRREGTLISIPAASSNFSTVSTLHNSKKVGQKQGCCMKKYRREGEKKNEKGQITQRQLSKSQRELTNQSLKYTARKVSPSQNWLRVRHSSKPTPGSWEQPQPVIEGRPLPWRQEKPQLSRSTSTKTRLLILYNQNLDYTQRLK